MNSKPNSCLRPQTSKLRAQNSKLETRNSKLRTQNSELRTSLVPQEAGSKLFKVFHISIHVLVATP